ncbi:MAG: hypothetical protein EZS28_005062 [Streblomastix strix]|uniref:Endoplasmic reticulum junction formation protein lunapark n=1 Tax=Streblomastix strix TaxID=222440 RepID=A0A5J4WYX2_9EUKA|nr:MAG: hypothetical protein EZS28_005062 [Streblomastix strix]
MHFFRRNSEKNLREKLDKIAHDFEKQIQKVQTIPQSQKRIQVIILIIFVLFLFITSILTYLGYIPPSIIIIGAVVYFPITMLTDQWGKMRLRNISKKMLRNVDETEKIAEQILDKLSGKQAAAILSQYGIPMIELERKSFFTELRKKCESYGETDKKQPYQRSSVNSKQQGNMKSMRQRQYESGSFDPEMEQDYDDEEIYDEDLEYDGQQQYDDQEQEQIKQKKQQQDEQEIQKEEDDEEDEDVELVSSENEEEEQNSKADEQKKIGDESTDYKTVIIHDNENNNNTKVDLSEIIEITELPEIPPNMRVFSAGNKLKDKSSKKKKKKKKKGIKNTQNEKEIPKIEENKQNLNKKEKEQKKQNPAHNRSQTSISNPHEPITKKIHRKTRSVTKNVALKLLEWLADEDEEEQDEDDNSNKNGKIGKKGAFGENEDNSDVKFALICEKCKAHNGLVRKEELNAITYYCPRCNFLNGKKKPKVA